LVEEINLIKSIRALKNHYEIRTEGLSNSEQEELKKQYSLTHSKGVEHVVKNLALLSKHILLHRFLKEDLLSQIGITLINLLFYTESNTQFFSFTKTDDEITIYLSTDYDYKRIHNIFNDTNSQDPWCQLKVNEGELGFLSTGVVQSIAAPLCAARITIFYISTFETDYTFIRECDTKASIVQLEKSGCKVKIL